MENDYLLCQTCGAAPYEPCVDDQQGALTTYHDNRPHEPRPNDKNPAPPLVES